MDPSPCLNCGACCATYRVSFYWAEADDAPGGQVPTELTETLTPHLRCMRGTSQREPRCEQLVGAIPGARCGIYALRPSPCRELEPYDADGQVSSQCARARARHGLAELPLRPPSALPAVPPIPPPVRPLHREPLDHEPIIYADPAVTLVPADRAVAAGRCRLGVLGTGVGLGAAGPQDAAAAQP